MRLVWKSGLVWRIGAFAGGFLLAMWMFPL